MFVVESKDVGHEGQTSQRRKIRAGRLPGPERVLPRHTLRVVASRPNSFRVLGFPVTITPGFLLGMLVIYIINGPRFGLWLVGVAGGPHPLPRTRARARRPPLRCPRPPSRSTSWSATPASARRARSNGPNRRSSPPPVRSSRSSSAWRCCSPSDRTHSITPSSPPTHSGSPSGGPVRCSDSSTSSR